MNGNTAVRQLPVSVTAPPFTLGLDDPAIRRDIEQIRSLKRSALSANVDAAIAIGEVLDRIKSQLKRRLWTRLLRDELRLGAETARLNIGLYKFAKANPHSVVRFKHLGTSKLRYLAALDPGTREKVLTEGTHRLPGVPIRTLEAMNQSEFLTFIRGVDPSFSRKSPRMRHLIRDAIQASDRLASSLTALKKRNVGSSPLFGELEDSLRRLGIVMRS